MPLRDVLLALLVVTVWGFNFVVIKVGVAEVPPLLLTALRFVFSALPAALLLPRPAVSWRLIVAFGLMLGVVKFGLLFVAMGAGMPAGLSSLVLQMQAFFTIALATLALGERPHRWQVLGGLVALAGIVAIGSGSGASAPLMPFLLVLVAAFFWGVANILAKRAGRVDMLAFIVWASLVPPLPLLALSLVFEGPDAMGRALTGISWLSVGAVAYLAYPTTLLGFAIWNALLSRHAAAAVAPFSLLVPVVGLSSAALVLGEPLTGTALAGSVLVFLGLALNVFGPRLRRRRPRAAP